MWVHSVENAAQSATSEDQRNIGRTPAANPMLPVGNSNAAILWGSRYQIVTSSPPAHRDVAIVGDDDEVVVISGYPD